MASSATAALSIGLVRRSSYDVASTAIASRAGSRTWSHAAGIDRSTRVIATDAGAVPESGQTSVTVSPTASSYSSKSAHQRRRAVSRGKGRAHPTGTPRRPNVCVATTGSPVVLALAVSEAESRALHPATTGSARSGNIATNLRMRPPMTARVSRESCGPGRTSILCPGIDGPALHRSRPAAEVRLRPRAAQEAGEIHVDRSVVLPAGDAVGLQLLPRERRPGRRRFERVTGCGNTHEDPRHRRLDDIEGRPRKPLSLQGRQMLAEIGRASCRERV